MENKKQNNELIDILNEIDLTNNKNEKIEENKTEVTDEELKQNIYEQETISKKDFANLDEEIAKLACEIEEESCEDEELNKKFNLKFKLKNSLEFIFKYIASSAAIFVMLLIWTNFSAYSELAMNYINPDSIKTQEKLLYSSVLDVNNNNKNLWEKKPEKIDKNKEKIEEIKEKIEKRNIITITKNKTFHSIDKLVKEKSWEDLNIPVEIVPFENRIIIPKIWKNIPLIDVKTRNVKSLKKLEEVFSDDLAKWVVRYPWSVKPWETWNVFIFGHSSNFPWVKWKYNQVFALLNNLQKWNKIIVYYNQKKYIYQVKTKTVINPWEVWILKRNKWKKELTLMTCWPVWTTLKRKIIIAELIK